MQTFGWQPTERSARNLSDSLVRWLWRAVDMTVEVFAESISRKSLQELFAMRFRPGLQGSVGSIKISIDDSAHAKGPDSIASPILNFYRHPCIQSACYPCCKRRRQAAFVFNFYLRRWMRKMCRHSRIAFMIQPATWRIFATSTAFSIGMCARHRQGIHTLQAMLSRYMEPSLQLPQKSVYTTFVAIPFQLFRR